MKNNRILIYCFTAALLVLAVVLVVISNNNTQVSLFDVAVVSDDKSEDIGYFESEDGTVFVFVPSHAFLHDVVIQKGDIDVYIDKHPLADTLRCSNFQEDKEYSLSYTRNGKKIDTTLVFMKSSGVPTMHIDTMSGSLEYLHKDKNHDETATMRLYASDGSVDYDGELSSISGRGNYTWENFDKKPYNITLSTEADLLNMGSAHNWVLLANALDDSNIRNKYLYDMADRVGLKYTSNSSFVELYLNGEYAGLYLLAEKVEVHKNRVDIANDNSTLLSFVPQVRLSSDNFTYIQTSSTQAFRVHYPQSCSDQELVELKDRLQSVENAIMASDGIDPVTGKAWFELVDIDSFVRKYLMEEIAANWDACSVSQYFYYDSADPTGKLYASPVWDYDNTLGNKNAFGTQNPQMLYGNHEYVRQDLYTPWFYHLYQKPEFKSRLIELYQTEFLPAFELSLDFELFNFANEIYYAHNCDKIRWNTDADIFEETEHISSYISERLTFLTRLWVNGENYHTVRLSNNFYVHYIVFEGDGLTELPVPQSTPVSSFEGWYIEGTDEKFDTDTTVSKDINLYAKYKTTNKEKFSDILKLLPVTAFFALFVWLILKDRQKHKRGDEVERRQ